MPIGIYLRIVVAKLHQHQKDTVIGFFISFCVSAGRHGEDEIFQLYRVVFRGCFGKAQAGQEKAKRQARINSFFMEKSSFEYKMDQKKRRARGPLLLDAFFPAQFQLMASNRGST